MTELAAQTGILSGIQLSTIIGAVVGFTGGLISTFGLFWLRKKNKETKLRRAIYAELDASSWIPQLDEDELNSLKSSGEKPRNTNIPHTVYDAHIGDIGLLSIDEIENIVDYYDTVYMAEEELGIMLNQDIEDDQRTRTKFVDKTYPHLVSSYESSKTSIEEKIDIKQDGEGNQENNKGRET